MPRSRGTVYRGSRLTSQELAKYNVGQTITEAAFTSTTKDKSIFDDNKNVGISLYVNEMNTLFVISSQRQSNGRDVAPFSSTPWEQEVLFPPGTKFNVRTHRLEGTPRRHVIYLDEMA